MHIYVYICIYVCVWVCVCVGVCAWFRLCLLSYARVINFQQMSNAAAKVYMQALNIQQLRGCYYISDNSCLS